MSDEDEGKQPWNFQQHSSALFSLTSICFISHFQFFSNLKECALSLRRLITASQQILFPPSLQAQYDAWHLLVEAEPTIASPDYPRGVRYLRRKLNQIEEWIERLLMAPAPKVGETYVKLELFPPDQIDHPPPSLIFALPDRDRLSLCDFPLHLPLELLGVTKCLQVVVSNH